MIEIKNVKFSYHGKRAESVSAIDLQINKGEFVLLCGRSGCGKTTVTRLLNGLIPHFYEGALHGEAFIDGKSIRNMKLHQLARLVGSVFQDPRSQFFTVDTTSEIVFGCENMGVPRAEMIHRLNNTVAVMKIEQLLERSLFKLSSGEKQKIAIASVHAAGPSVYVLDEPSANLDHQATEELRVLLGLLKEKGHTVIIAEHRLYYLKDLVDRVVYMEGGKIAAEYDRENFLSMPDTERIDKGLRCVFPAKLVLQRSGSEMFAPPAYLQLDAVCFRYEGSPRILDGLCLKAGQGEIIGVTGLNGAGKSTFAKILCGLVSEQQGKVSIESGPAKAGERLKKSYFVMQDADYQLFTESVEEELALGNENMPHLTETVAETMETLGLAAFKSCHPASLSGGQKQRVTIAVAIVKGADILIFDEPTSGLDAENMRRVASLLQRVAAKGKAVFVITHDYEFIVHTCTRIVNLAGGRVSADFFLNDSSLEELKELFGFI
ncbi:ABC transporter ATP-binding protein [Sporomusa termitida]|uniref:HMP/thiamine import ATP-binding protein YkoD n=1 Tax=Sporomusa termitida TaxID=2377 RepID=A0A517DRE0_9FIRM|nr:energy-coupling factor ABC transporter ATP-binding protein [Sporomusa termitida]QDR79887.1 Putative HMP/thiamine import ATP-binding protein YkoD [Sporomusa termitida]